MCYSPISIFYATIPLPQSNSPPNRSIDLISDGGWTYRTSFRSLYGQFDLSAWLIIAFQRSLSPPPLDYAKQPPPITDHASSEASELGRAWPSAGSRLSAIVSGFSYAWLQYFSKDHRVYIYIYYLYILNNSTRLRIDARSLKICIYFWCRSCFSGSANRENNIRY